MRVVTLRLVYNMCYSLKALIFPKSTDQGGNASSHKTRIPTETGFSSEDTELYVFDDLLNSETKYDQKLLNSNTQ